MSDPIPFSEDVTYNKPMRILIVEDDKKVGGFLKRGLQEEQYAVDVCRNGTDALYMVQLNPYDVIILDIMLPGIDGFEICHRLRSEPKTARIPILMLTAKAQEADRQTGLKVGADDYLTKPVLPAEIIRRVQALLAITEYASPILGKDNGQRQRGAGN